MIPRETIDRIFEAAKVEEVVGSYVTLKKRGANLLAQENIFPLGYEWIMEDIRLVEDGAGVSFLETAKNYLEKDGKSTGNELLTYEENPLYKYYYRFLTPIKYSHPDYEECEDSYWPMLFQLLFGEGKNVKVIDGENGLPEIEFIYCCFLTIQPYSFRHHSIPDIRLISMRIER